MKRLLGYFLFLLSVISALFGVKFLIVKEWSYSAFPLAMAAIYVFFAAKLLQSQENRHTDKENSENENNEKKQTNVSDNSAIEIDAFEISEILIKALESQLATSMVGKKFKHPDAISGYLYGLTYGYLKAEDKLSKSNHFSLTENIYLGIFGDVIAVTGMLREHFIENLHYNTGFGRSVFNIAAEDGFQFAKSNGKIILRLEQVLVAAQKNKTAGLEDALYSLGKGTRAAINFTKENIINPISPPLADYKRCPFCDEKVKYAAKKCKHCGEWFSDEQLRQSPLKNVSKKTSKKASITKKNSGEIEQNNEPANAANSVTKEIQLILNLIDQSKKAAEIKIRTNDFALGYILGYVDGFLQRKKLFEDDEIERIAVCTFVFIDLFGNKDGPSIFGNAADKQLDNKEIHLGMRIGGEEGFNHIASNKSSLFNEFTKPKR